MNSGGSRPLDKGGRWGGGSVSLIQNLGVGGLAPQAPPLDQPLMKFNQFSAFGTFFSYCAHIIPVFSTS